MVQDLVYNLCESFVKNIDGVAGIGKKIPPTPITYLTQWKIVGNSEVHGVGNLTSWKVSGNSVVDNNTILSCGDLEQDGKYHVKISNGVDVYDIALNEPLRKVNDVADTIEFANGVATLTRNLAKSTDLGSKEWRASKVQDSDDYYMTIGTNVLNPTNKIVGSVEATALCSLYNTVTAYETHTGAKEGIGISSTLIRIYDKNYNQQSSVTAFKQHIKDIELIYWIEPITEVIDVSPFPVSPTDTYTSANVVPYSTFEHTENKEIWSCGEYNHIDGKYHILVQPQGGSIADIALDEPLRKVNDVADTIEFPSETEGKALVIRCLFARGVDNNIYPQANAQSQMRWWMKKDGKKGSSSILANILSNKYSTITAEQIWNGISSGVAIDTSGNVFLFDLDYTESTDKAALIAANTDTIILYELETPTTELVDAPQIEEADSYTCEISQGAKAVSWSSFETE